jgi:hypothetical protein
MCSLSFALLQNPNAYVFPLHYRYGYIFLQRRMTDPLPLQLLHPIEQHLQIHQVPNMANVYRIPVCQKERTSQHTVRNSDPLFMHSQSP